MFRSFKYAFFAVLLFQACSGVKQKNELPVTLIQIGIQKLDPALQIDENSLYMTEIELSQSIAMVYPGLKKICKPRQIFIYEKSNLKQVSFPTMTIFAYGKDVFIESFDKDERKLKEVAKKVADLGNGRIGVITGSKSAIMTRVKIRKRMTYMQLLYILKRCGLGKYLISCQYICRQVPGGRVKRLYKHWMRVQKEY